ncbi:MAG: coenzyme F420-0:L-glutamate ligase [Candidatus Heimdallarchaeota archaeon]|nr:coenzyme F420-0:L-glutamate ligase [Candidatus Heimdallarchaeota archaeon]
MVVQIYPVKSPKIIGFGEDVFDIFINALSNSNVEIEDGDIISITSKVISMQQKAAVLLDSILPSEEARTLGIEASMDPRVAQLVMDEAEGEIIGQVFHAILAKTPYGLSANAGIDLSNCPDGYALLLPKQPNQEAVIFRNKIKEHFKKTVAVIITDSRTIPLRKGTTAVAIGIAGMEPIIDERGNKDLYGYTMAISSRAIADNVANCCNLVMGETNEQTPFAIAKGIEYHKAEGQSMLSALMPEDQCLYFAPLMKAIEAYKEKSKIR